MDRDKNTIDPLLDAKQVKTILRCSLPLVYKMAARGQLPCIRWECPGDGRPRTMVRFERSAILEFIKEHRC